MPIVSAIDKLDGRAATERWLEGFASNAKRYDDNEGIVAAVEGGQVAAGDRSTTTTGIEQRAEVGAANVHSKLYYFGHEDPGALVNVSGAGALKSSKHPALAQRFLAFLVSKEGQNAMTHSGDWEYPLVAGVAPPPGLRPFASLQPPRVGPADLGDGSERAGADAAGRAARSSDGGGRDQHERQVVAGARARAARLRGRPTPLLLAGDRRGGRAARAAAARLPARPGAVDRLDADRRVCCSARSSARCSSNTVLLVAVATTACVDPRRRRRLAASSAPTCRAGASGRCSRRCRSPCRRSSRATAGSRSRRPSSTSAARR